MYEDGGVVLSKVLKRWAIGSGKVGLDSLVVVEGPSLWINRKGKWGDAVGGAKSMKIRYKKMRPLVERRGRALARCLSKIFLIWILGLMLLANQFHYSPYAF